MELLPDEIIEHIMCLRHKMIFTEQIFEEMKTVSFKNCILKDCFSHEIFAVNKEEVLVCIQNPYFYMYDGWCMPKLREVRYYKHSFICIEVMKLRELKNSAKIDSSQEYNTLYSACVDNELQPGSNKDMVKRLLQI